MGLRHRAAASLTEMTDALAMGHEIFGEVVELGDQVKDIEIGKKYVAYPWIGCGAVSYTHLTLPTKA